MRESTRIQKLSLAFMIFALGIWYASVPAAAAIGIAATGSWSRPITTSDLQGTGAGGSDLNSTYESNSDQVVITISGTQDNNDTWRVEVRRSTDIWDSRLTLSVKRTGEGTGGGYISGGTAYQALGTTDSTFFSGAGDRSSINIQLQLSGMSALISAAIYSTTITVSVVDT